MLLQLAVGQAFNFQGVPVQNGMASRIGFALASRKISAKQLRPGGGAEHHAEGSVAALGGPAINIATASVSVSLGNLVIVPFQGGGGTGGTVMTNGSSVTIRETLI